MDLKVSENGAKGVDYWTRRISDQEMPALCSTVKTLEQLAKDDVSSLSILGRSVMHDNALTSRILRVANSAVYNKGVNQVTTVSRAAVVLGFDTIRNICITAKLLSSLLENKNLTPNVYQRLLKLMAQSFQAAMIARMMLADHEESLREEVFIASLLYHLGESAFWSMGGEAAEKLDISLQECTNSSEVLAVSREHLGTSFTQLTQGIARNWGLGDVLLKSLASPDERTPEIRCIFLANKLSELLSQRPVDKDALSLRMKQIADMLDLDQATLRVRLSACSKSTHQLAETYGAKVLVEFLADAEDAFTSLERTEEPPQNLRMPDVHFQLKKLRELTQFAVVKTDFNVIVTSCLEGILLGIGVDRAAVLLLSPNKKLLQPRIAIGDDVELIKHEWIIELDDSMNLFRQCIELKSPLFINDPNGAKWRLQLTDRLRKQLPSHGFLIAPVIVDMRVIGLFYADRGNSERQFNEEDFDSFTHFSQLANLCFSVSVRR